jgi:hypothetical protein
MEKVWMETNRTEAEMNDEVKRKVEDDDTMVYRNELLEEVAKVIEQFKIPFAADTVASFAALVREMKR